MPSQLLHRMQQLLGELGPAPNSAFVCELFLQWIPFTVCMVLASSDATLSLTQVTEMDDRIGEVASPPTVAPVITPSTCVEDVCQLMDALTHLVAALESPHLPSQDSPASQHQSRFSSHLFLQNTYTYNLSLF